MFFLKKDKNSFLQNCGHVIENFKNLSSFINEKCLEDFSKIRTSTFRYTFGDLLSLDEIKNRILNTRDNYIVQMLEFSISKRMAPFNLSLIRWQDIL